MIAGGGLEGGRGEPGGDHRMAMAFAVAVSALGGRSTVEGMEDADVSFPGFADPARPGRVDRGRRG